MKQLILSLGYPHKRQLLVPAPDDVKIDDVRRTRYSAINTITIYDAFGEQNLVRDVDRYRLRMTNGRIILLPHSTCEVRPCFNRYNDHDPKCPNTDYSKTIVIILESPHVDEYHGDVGQPIAPAQGKTGSNIQGWLDCVLRSCPTLYDELDDGTRVVLCNPIQFQTSLASIVTIPTAQRDEKVRDQLRDAVWSVIWECEAVRSEFKARLDDYSPDFVINACTHDVGCYKSRCRRRTKECKKRKIREFLSESVESPRKYEVAHPYSWFTRRSLYCCDG